jgi:hypothetical protein
VVDDRLFFQIAAGLIPAVLFGGLVTGILARSGDTAQRGVINRLVFLALGTFAVAFAVVAEFLAIELSISPERPSSLVELED